MELIFKIVFLYDYFYYQYYLIYSNIFDVSK